MFILIGVLFVLVGIILIWFHIPYSPVKRDFQNDIDTLMSENQLRTTDDVFTEDSQGKNRPTLKIDYTQYNFIDEPCRIALIDSSMFGIPFEGYDYYQNG